MDYKIIFNEHSPYPIIEIDSKTLLSASINDMAKMIEQINFQMQFREKKIEDAHLQEVGWFLRNVVSEDKIAKWSKMENVAQELWVLENSHETYTFDLEGNFVGICNG